MRKKTAALVLCCLVAPAHAQMVYKCVGKGGAVSFQSEPCAANERMVKAVHAPPDREAPRPQYSPQVQQQVTTGNNYGQVIYNTPTAGERDQRRAKCQQARANREATLARVGLARTHDLLRRLDNTVYEACKGLYGTPMAVVKKISAKKRKRRSR